MFRCIRKIWLPLLLPVALGLAAPANALDPHKLISQFTHTAWSAKDGISAPVRAIVQTHDGYLWLGTQAGLYRFDGLHFVLWEPSFGEHLPTYSISSLCVARDGSLWIGFSSGGVGRLASGHIAIFSPDDGVPGGGVLSIAEDAAGTMWAGGEYGLSKFDQAKWQRVGIEAGYPAPGAQQIQADREGSLWVETDGLNSGLSKDPVQRHTLYMLAAKSQRFVATGLVVGYRSAMTRRPNGEVWILNAHDNTAQRLSGTDKRVVSIRAGPGSLPPTLFETDNVLWVNNHDQGISRVAADRQSGDPPPEQFGPHEGLSGGRIYSALEDREGNVWFGTDGGLDRFTSTKVTSFSAREGLSPDQSIALSATGDGSVWIISYTRDVIQRYQHGRLSSSRLAPYSASDTTRILSLFSEGENTVWVGGNFKLANGPDGRFSYPKEHELEPGANVEAIGKDAAGDLWVARTRWLPGAGIDKVGGILRSHESEWRDLRSRFELPKFRCRVIHGDSQGTVWFGFEDGEVVAYKDDDLRVYSTTDGLPGARVLVITTDRSGHIWIGGQGGLSRLRNGRFVTLTKDNGLPGSSVSGIVEDQDGFLWLAGSLGILRVDPRELDAAVENHAHRLQGIFVGPSDGLRGLPRQEEPFPVATRASDGRLWFATTGGVAMIDPRHWTRNEIAPPVVIESIRADDRSYSPETGLRLPPNTRNLEFHFTALSLTDPARVEFRYRLDGYDNDWRGPATAREAKYTNLSPRDYEFRVVASNNDGVWNPAGASVGFTILPVFYQTIWFRLLCVVALAYFLWEAYRWRVRQLAVSLDAQFEGRLAERTRIAQDFHDTLLQGIVSASMFLHLADRQVAALSTAKPFLTRGLDLIRQVVEDGRKSIQGLRMSGLDLDNLEQALARIPRELAASEGCNFRVLVHGAPKALHPVIRDEVYRIGREALTNAVRHSAATAIEVEVAYTGGRLRVLVRDDGCGIDEQVLRSGREGHWGLVGMRGRANKIGSQLRVWSRVSGGTEVELSVPGHVAFRSFAPKGARWWRTWLSCLSAERVIGARPGETDE